MSWRHFTLPDCVHRDHCGRCPGTDNQRHVKCVCPCHREHDDG